MFPCGSHDFVEQPVGLQRQQVAQLVASPIEVEYNRHTYRVPIVVRPTRLHGQQASYLDKTRVWNRKRCWCGGNYGTFS